jgi:hypothetical protein
MRTTVLLALLTAVAAVRADDGLSYSANLFRSELLGRCAIARDHSPRIPTYPSVKVWGYMQFRYVFNHRDDVPDDDDDAIGFQTSRTRLYVDSKITPDISARVRFTFNRATGAAGLDQAYGNFNLPDNFKLRIGQFGLPLFRDEYISADKQLAVNSSPTNILFNQGRCREFSSAASLTRGASGRLTPMASAPATPISPTPKKRTSRSPAAPNGRSPASGPVSMTTHPFPAATSPPCWAAQRHTEQGSQLASGQFVDNLVYLTADLGLEGDGWNAFISGVFTWVDGSTTGWNTLGGFIIQGGFFVSEKTELFARYDLTFVDPDAPDLTDFGTITAGFNHYFIPASHALKFTANVLYFFDEQATSPISPDTNVGLLDSTQTGQWVFQAQMQMVF